MTRTDPTMTRERIVTKEWTASLIARTRAAQGLPPTIADDPVGIELAAKFLTSASALDASLLPATDGASRANGAVASTRAAVLGEVAAARPERAGLASHAVTAPTTKAGAGAATPTPTNNAAVMTRREGA